MCQPHVTQKISVDYFGWGCYPAGVDLFDDPAEDVMITPEAVHKKARELDAIEKVNVSSKPPSTIDVENEFQF